MYQSSISMHLLKSSICINYFELYMHKFFKHIEFKQILWSLICIDDLINWLKYIMLKCISGIVHEFISSNSSFLSHAVCENLSFAQVWCVLMCTHHVDKSISHLFQMILLIFQPSIKHYLCGHTRLRYFKILWYAMFCICIQTFISNLSNTN